MTAVNSYCRMEEERLETDMACARNGNSADWDGSECLPVIKVKRTAVISHQPYSPNALGKGWTYIKQKCVGEKASKLPVRWEQATRTDAAPLSCEMQWYVPIHSRSFI
jgi:hypothetical protein